MRIFAIIAGLILTFTGGLCVIASSGSSGGPELRGVTEGIRLLSLVALTTGGLTLGLALWPTKAAEGKTGTMSALRKRSVIYVLVVGLILIFGIMNSSTNQLYNSIFLLAVPVVIWAVLDVLTSGKSVKGEGPPDTSSEDEPS